MKTSLPYRKAVICLCTLLFLIQSGFSQDNSYAPALNGAAGTLTGTPADQSATLYWKDAQFPAPAGYKAGYLLFFATSTPSLINAPNGFDPEHAVYNGIIVETSQTNLPSLPLTQATASGLNNGTTYHFLLVAYIWDGNSPASYVYSNPIDICLTIPPAVPPSLQMSAGGITSSMISGSFTPPQFPPDGYLVLCSSSPDSSVINGSAIYQPGQNCGNSLVIQAGSNTAFNTSACGRKLDPATTYYIRVFSYSISGCSGNPVYSSQYVSSSITTLPAALPRDSSYRLEFTGTVPNPAHDQTTLQINSPDAENVSILLFSADGHSVQQHHVFLQTGSNQFNLNLSSLARGVYFIRVLFTGGGAKSLPLLIQ